ncbi:RHS repeat-associated core domain-containing protein, partial [Dehalobacter sp.]
NYVTKAINQLGKEINYVNDSYGQATQVTTPTGEVTQFSYDGQENLRTVTDNAGNTATYTQDSNGNVTDVEIKENGTTSVYKNSFEYDEYGNMVKETVKPNLSQPANDETTEYLYDESGRLTGKVNPGDSPTNSSVTLGYEYSGLDILKILNGPKYSFDYNLEGQVTKEELFNSSDTKIGEFSYTYDGMGRLATLTEKDGSGTEVSKISQPTGQSMYSQTDQLNGFDLTVKQQTSNPITYLFTYLSNNLVKTITAAGKQFNLYFNEGGLFQSRVNPNNTGDEYKYNDAGQVIESKTNNITKSTNGNNTTTGVSAKWSSLYTYDSDGRITAITGQGAGSPSATYTYNNGTEELNRLTQAQITSGSNNYTFDYSYDSRGNILDMDLLIGGSVQNQTFTYNDDNQITTSGFVYDNSGNLTSAVVKGVTYNYVYDKANRLIEVKDGSNQTIATYTYDSQGQRLTKTTGGSTITYHYANGGVLYETKSGDADNILHALYINSPSGRPLAVSMNYNINNPGSNTWYYYHYNVHGDVIAVTDGNGNIFREYVYDPYGNILSVKDGTGNSVNISADSAFNHTYTYAGYRFDKETGLYYLNARYYEAGIGRFLTKDNVLGNPGNIQTLNRYAYCGGDPVNCVDPSGQVFMLITGGIGAVAGGIIGGIVAYNNGGDWKKGALIGAAAGGLIGLGAGAAAGVLLAGSATASTGAVMAGGGALLAGAVGGTTAAVARNTQRVASNVGTVYGKLGTVIEKAPINKISGMASSHPVQQAINRGVSPNTIINTVRNPQVTLSQWGGERFAYISENATIIMNKNGQLVTVWAKSDFGPLVIKALAESR